MPLVLLLAFGFYWFYPATVREIKSIAVLPFEDLSEGQTEKYLGVSLPDALGKKFGGLKQLTVRPVRPVLKYADSREDASKIGRELGVDAVLDGRIQRVGDRVRVSVQLVRTSDNATIWTENFDDDFTNFFAVQDSISQQVVQSLALELDPAERAKFNRRGTENAAAYQEFLRGRFFWNKRSADNLQKAVEHFNRAVELDPTSLSTNTAPALPYLLSRQFEKALAVTGKVLEMDAGFPLALHYRSLALFRLERRDEAFETYHKAVAASDSAFFKADLGRLYARAGRTAEARKVLAELHRMAKERHVSPYNFAILHNALNERELAFEYLRKTIAEHDSFVITLPVAAAFENVRDDPRFGEILRQAKL